jgi:hypothetical protein
MISKKTYFVPASFRRLAHGAAAASCIHAGSAVSFTVQVDKNATATRASATRSVYDRLAMWELEI